MSVPGSRLNETVPEPVSTLSVAPTILKSAGQSSVDLPEPALVTENGVQYDPIDGKAFASATGENEHEGIRRFAVRGERWKAVLECDIDSKEVLKQRVFDLQEDPGEMTELKPGEPAAEVLIKQLQTFSNSRLDTTDNRDATEITEEQSNEIDERLEALGYK